MARQEHAGGLEVAQQVPGEFTRILISLGGAEAARQYEDLSDKMERGGAEAARAYRERMDSAVASGAITRQQADNATVLTKGTQPTKAQLLKKAREIDAKFGHYFSAPIGGVR